MASVAAGRWVGDTEGEPPVYKDIKARLSDIVEIAQSVPDQFQEKCFEVLLEAAIQERSRAGGVVPGLAPEADRKAAPPPPPAWRVPGRVDAFLRRHGLPEEDLRAAVLVADDEVHIVKEPSTGGNAARQLDWAVLLALRSALLGGAFESDAESVRSICEEKGCYDRGNFAGNFKREPGKTLFRDVLERRGESQKLAEPGEERLAKLIGQLAKASDG